MRALPVVILLLIVLLGGLLLFLAFHDPSVPSQQVETPLTREKLQP